MVDEREGEFDEKSMGEDSVNSDGFNDNDVELTNETAEYYNDVKVHQWLGGLDERNFEGTENTPEMSVPKTSSLVAQPSEYKGFPLV